MYGGRDRLRRKGWGYDIREVPEELYQAVLACRRAESCGTAGDLGRCCNLRQGAVRVRKGQEMG
jgi:hypothetical protein